MVGVVVVDLRPVICPLVPMAAAVEHRAAVEEGHVVRHAVRRPILHGEGEHRVLQSLHGVPCAGVVGIGDDVAPRWGTRSAKAWKECSISARS